ncbi:hypothetical protein GCM10027037_06590 [Mucilaginibacter koreensis]
MAAISSSGIQSSKYPLAFNIDLHVDDSKGVEMEGQRYGFCTVIVDEQQAEWGNFILSSLDNFYPNKKASHFNERLSGK